MINTKQIQRADPYSEYHAVEHFLGNTAAGNIGFNPVLVAGGTITLLQGTINSAGITRLSTSTMTTGAAALRYPLSMAPPGTTGRHNFHCNFRFRIPVAPVSTTETTLWVMGFSNTVVTGTAEPASGLYLYVDSSDGVIYGVTGRAGAKSYSPYITPPSTSSWFTCRMSLFRNGAARISIQLDEGAFTEFNYTAAGNLVPNTAVGLQFSVTKSAGLIARTLDLDFVEIAIDRSVPPTIV